MFQLLTKIHITNVRGIFLCSIDDVFSFRLMAIIQLASFITVPKVNC